jgi:SARP family transcriptional regulator, regulator of embCAB operon
MGDRDGGTGPGGLRLRLLGSFELTGQGGPLVLGTGEERLLALLALQPGAIPRELAAACLWPVAPRSRSTANLRTTIWRVGNVAAGALVAGRDRLALDAGVVTDLDRAHRVTTAIISSGHDMLPSPDGLALLEHDLLPGWYDDWVVAARERFQQRRLHALESASQRLSSAGLHAQAIDAATIAVAGEPLRESAHRALVSAYIAEGNVGAALRQYERCRRILSAELGLGCSRELAALVAPLEAV